MTDCRLIVDPPAAGAWNMAVDEVLWGWSGRSGGCCLRLYRWNQPTLSLGYFQSFDQRQQHAASRSCAAVRRISGGGAIVHDAELTYSLTVPLSHPAAPSRQRLYDVVHQSIVELLADWGVVAAIQPATDSPKPAERPFLCFQRRMPGDVLVERFKVAGSAQRRSHAAVLQHGSLLLAQSDAAPELPGLRELAGFRHPVEEVVDHWLGRLSRCLETRWLRSELSLEERTEAAQVVADKHAANAWIRYRNHLTG